MDNSKVAKFDPKELFFLVAKFLEASPCQEAAKVLKAELSEHQLLPTARDWLGQERQIAYQEVDTRLGHVGSNHLGLLCSSLVDLLHKHDYQKIPRLSSLWGAGITSYIHDMQTNTKPPLSTALHVAQRGKELSLNFQPQPNANFCNIINARQISSSFDHRVFTSPILYEGLHKHCTVLGHLAAAFCVLFDKTGQCIITGADDDLLKVWSSRSGQLLATLRGHSAEVTDISLSTDNTMLASGSLDKSVRVWSAQSSAPVAVLMGHQSLVTSVQFSPSLDENCRCIASTGKDGFLCFWQWLPDQETFSTHPIKFMEKNRMGDQTLCSAFSPGGKYFVTGGTDHILRVYVCNPGPPALQAELDGHKDRIMSVQFGNTGEGVFATASCDATARIWRYKEGAWSCVVLEVDRQEYANTLSGDKPQVTMVGWEKTDKYLVTAFTPDCTLRVWDSQSGQLIRRLKGHTGEVFVLEAHPTDSRILLSAGHDGLLIVWDMLVGVAIKSVLVEDEEGKPAAIFDCKFSPDGLMCAAVDMNGCLSLLGFGSSQEYLKHPREQFFHTDYRPLMRDNQHYVVDEQSQLPPHLLPPPYLVNIDGNAYSIKHQECLLRLIRPVKRNVLEKRKEELNDYDEYMKKRLARVNRGNFGFERARQQVGGAGGISAGGRGLRNAAAGRSGVSLMTVSSVRVGEPSGIDASESGSVHAVTSCESRVSSKQEAEPASSEAMETAATSSDTLAGVAESESSSVNVATSIDARASPEQEAAPSKSEAMETGPAAPTSLGTPAGVTESLGMESSSVNVSTSTDTRVSPEQEAAPLKSEAMETGPATVATTIPDTPASMCESSGTESGSACVATSMDTGVSPAEETEPSQVVGTGRGPATTITDTPAGVCESAGMEECGLVDTSNTRVSPVQEARCPEVMGTESSTVAATSSDTPADEAESSGIMKSESASTSDTPVAQEEKAKPLAADFSDAGFLASADKKPTEMETGLVNSDSSSASDHVLTKVKVEPRDDKSSTEPVSKPIPRSVACTDHPSSPIHAPPSPKHPPQPLLLPGSAEFVTINGTCSPLDGGDKSTVLGDTLEKKLAGVGEALVGRGAMLTGQEKQACEGDEGRTSVSGGAEEGGRVVEERAGAGVEGVEEEGDSKRAGRENGRDLKMEVKEEGGEVRMEGDEVRTEDEVVNREGKLVNVGGEAEREGEVRSDGGEGDVVKRDGEDGGRVRSEDETARREREAARRDESGEEVRREGEEERREGEEMRREGEEVGREGEVRRADEEERRDEEDGEAARREGEEARMEGENLQDNPAQGEGEQLLNVVDMQESYAGQNMQLSLVYSLGLSEAESKHMISLWQDRTIIPPLEPSRLGAEMVKREQLFREEQELFELQSRRAPVVQPVPVQETSSKDKVKGRSLRSGRTLPQEEEELSESGGVSSEESGMEVEYMWESSTASSDISDWTAEVNFNAPRRKQRNKRRRRSTESFLTNNDLQDEDEEGGEESGHSGEENRARKSGTGGSKGKRPAKKSDLDYSVYATPDWLQQTTLHLSPYFPQVGDIVVYCHQGHQLYLKAVRKERLYPVHRNKMPWEKHTLQPQEFCQVANVRYCVGPPTLCSITLALVSPVSQDPGPSSSTESRISFSFKYHDMDSVLDFLVLESLYKVSVRTQWQEGDRFRSLIDGKFWYGTIKEKRAFSDAHPNSYWQCYSVLWDDQATDLLSPWDMEPIPEDKAAVTEEERDAPSRLSELVALQEATVVEAWGGEGEQGRILEGFQRVRELDESHMFIDPVDLEQVPEYCMSVAFPTDLSTITERLRNKLYRLRNKLYRRKRALLWELAQIAKNAVAFNEEDSLIVKHAKVLVQTLWKFVESPSIADPLECYAPEPEGGVVEEEVDVDPSEGVVFVDTRDLPPPEAVLPATPLKAHRQAILSSSGTETEALSPGWVDRAKELLQLVCDHEDAYPFQEPVDTSIYKDYLKLVKMPMDLSTVDANLTLGQYSNPQEFLKDVRLIFKNAFRYNPRGSQMFKLTNNLQTFFEAKTTLYFPNLRPERTKQGKHSTPPTPTVRLAREPIKRPRILSSAHSSVSSDDTGSFSKTRGYQRSLRSRANNHVSEDNSDVDLEDINSAKTTSLNVSSYSETLPLQRQTRSMLRNQPSVVLPSSSSRGASVDMDGDTDVVDEEEEAGEEEEKDGYSMRLRTRPGSDRRGKKRKASESDESDEEGSYEEEEEEEEMEEGEEEEADEASDEEYKGVSERLRPRSRRQGGARRRGRGRRGSGGRGRRRRDERAQPTRETSTRHLRKRVKMVSYSEDEEEEDDLLLDSEAVTTSRSGRIIKPTLKFS